MGFSGFSGLGSWRVEGLGFPVWGLGFAVQGLGLLVRASILHEKVWRYVDPLCFLHGGLGLRDSSLITRFLRGSPGLSFLEPQIPLEMQN